VLCDLIPGGFANEITAGQAAIVVDKIEPHGYCRHRAAEARS
jgi:hypothetical protein